MVGGNFTQVRVGTTTVPTRALVRLNGNGTIDLSFTSPLTGSSALQTGYLDPTGRLTLGGGFLTIGSYNPVGLVRLNPDASRDVSFIGRLLARSIIYTTLVEPGGKIMVGGGFDTLNSTDRKFVGRVNSDGSVDDTFVPDESIANGIQVIAKQPDGKYIVGSYGAVDGHALWRLNPDGSRDTSFQLPTFGSNAFVLALAIQADGKIWSAAGSLLSTGRRANVLPDSIPDGSLDSLTADLGTGGPPRIEDFIVTRWPHSSGRDLSFGQRHQCSEYRQVESGRQRRSAIHGEQRRQFRSDKKPDPDWQQYLCWINTEHNRRQRFEISARKVGSGWHGGFFV